jgi:hypothetical protein
MIVESASPDEFEEVTTAREWKSATLDLALASVRQFSFENVLNFRASNAIFVSGADAKVAPALSAAGSVVASTLVSPGLEDPPRNSKGLARRALPGAAGRFILGAMARALLRHRSFTRPATPARLAIFRRTDGRCEPPCDVPAD